MRYLYSKLVWVSSNDDCCHKWACASTGRVMKVRPATRIGNSVWNVPILSHTFLNKWQHGFPFHGSQFPSFIGVFDRVKCALGHLLCVSITNYACCLHAVFHCCAQCGPAGMCNFSWRIILNDVDMEIFQLNSLMCAQKNVCYRLLGLIGAIDLCAIVLGSTVMGVLSIIGIPYCLYRWTFKMMSSCCGCKQLLRLHKSDLNSVVWFSYIAACAVLALCRCAQMHSAQMLNRLFVFFCWLIKQPISIIYSIKMKYFLFLTFFTLI
jgi:hypothetical protein